MATLRELTTARYGTDIGVGDDTEATGAIAGLLSRRSIRSYRDDPVADALVDLLLACAQSAPSKSNLQQYSILVVKDADRRKRLAPWCPRTAILETVPGLVVFLADMRRNQRIGAMRAKPHDNNNLDTFLNATVDAALAMGFFTVAAEDAGLGTACLSSMRDHMAGVARVLELPAGVFPIAGVMFGWPAADGYVNQRLPQSIAIHRDRYDDSALDAGIDQYDRTRHAVFPVPPERQRQRALYGEADFYGWSEAVARQLSIPERPEFKAFLQRHGFDLA